MKHEVSESPNNTKKIRFKLNKKKKINTNNSYSALYSFFKVARPVQGVFRRWGDKTSYLKNFKCSGEPKIIAALTL